MKTTVNAEIVGNQLLINGVYVAGVCDWKEFYTKKTAWYFKYFNKKGELCMSRDYTKESTAIRNMLRRFGLEKELVG